MEYLDEPQYFGSEKERIINDVEKLIEDMDCTVKDIRSVIRAFVNPYDLDDWDRHQDDEYVQIFKNVKENRPKGAIRTFKEDIFLPYLETYTGGTRDIASFIELVTNAMEEITDGLYKGEDRYDLYSELRSLERYAIEFHRNSLWGRIFQRKLDQKYARDALLHDFVIRVPLENYRKLQESLNLCREILSEYKKQLKEIKKELELQIPD